MENTAQQSELEQMYFEIEESPIDDQSPQDSVDLDLPEEPESTWSCSCPHNTHSDIQIGAVAEEHYRWALQEQIEWFRYNLDPYYPNFEEPASAEEQFEDADDEATVDGSESTNESSSVPSDIAAILEMLREVEDPIDENNNYL